VRLQVPVFVEPEKWPPNSPDLNTVDYSIWGALQQLVYRRRRIRDVEHLKEVVQTCWKQIGQDVIDRARGQFQNDCRSLLQPVEDTLSTALTNVLGATRTYHTYVFCCRNTELGKQK